MSRTSAVPEPAVSSLLALLTDQGVDLRPWEPLFSPALCAPHMRDYKLDVSVSLSASPSPRASVNDTGEPAQFRERLRAHHDQLGLPLSQLQAFLDLCPPGVVQTTLALKWESPTRTTLYLEELVRHPNPEDLRDALFGLYGLAPPQVAPLPLMALAVDFRAGQPIALKDYRHVDLVAQPALAPVLAPLFRIHPRTGQVRALLAQRWDIGGQALGDKLLWVTEANTPALAAATWRHVAGMVEKLGYRDSAGWGRVRSLVEGWPFGPDVIPYPDLVSVNRDANGDVEDFLLYISLK